MAALNSFGHSGTNAHLVVEEYIPDPSARRLRGDRPVLVLLSAQTEEALSAYAAKLGRFLQPAAAPVGAFGIATPSRVYRPRGAVGGGTSHRPGSTGYTLQVGREAMK